MFVQLLLLCIAVSMDGLGAGFSYGARNLRIPFLSLMVISLSSALTMGLAMFLGWTFKHYVSLYLARLLGGGILIVLGCWIAWQGISKDQEAFLNRSERHIHKEADSRPPGPVEQAAGQTVVPARAGGLNYLQFLPRIIFEPQKADLDHSGIINLSEAALLGLALACDAFGAGFAAALAGFNLWLTSGVVGLSKFFLISLGLWSGNYYREKLRVLPAHLFSGGLLIFLGILNIL